VFHCPTTRQDFNGNIVMDLDTYMRQRMQIIAANCPHCARVHRFLVADANYKAEAA